MQSYIYVDMKSYTCTHVLALTDAQAYSRTSTCLLCRAYCSDTSYHYLCLLPWRFLSLFTLAVLMLSIKCLCSTASTLSVLIYARCLIHSIYARARCLDARHHCTLSMPRTFYHYTCSTAACTLLAINAFFYIARRFILTLTIIDVVDGTRMQPEHPKAGLRYQLSSWSSSQYPPCIYDHSNIHRLLGWFTPPIS